MRGDLGIRGSEHLHVPELLVFVRELYKRGSWREHPSSRLAGRNRAGKNDPGGWTGFPAQGSQAQRRANLSRACPGASPAGPEERGCWAPPSPAPGPLAAASAPTHQGRALGLVPPRCPHCWLHCLPDLKRQAEGSASTVSIRPRRTHTPPRPPPVPGGPADSIFPT